MHQDVNENNGRNIFLVARESVELEGREPGLVSSFRHSGTVTHTPVDVSHTKRSTSMCVRSCERVTHATYKHAVRVRSKLSSLTSGYGPSPTGLMDKDFSLFFKVLRLDYMLRAVDRRKFRRKHGHSESMRRSEYETSEYCRAIRFDREFYSFSKSVQSPLLNQERIELLT